MRFFLLFIISLCKAYRTAYWWWSTTLNNIAILHFTSRDIEKNIKMRKNLRLKRLFFVLCIGLWSLHIIFQTKLFFSFSWWPGQSQEVYTQSFSSSTYKYYCIQNCAKLLFPLSSLYLIPHPCLFSLNSTQPHRIGGRFHEIWTLYEFNKMRWVELKFFSAFILNFYFYSLLTIFSLSFFVDMMMRCEMKWNAIFILFCVEGRKKKWEKKEED